MQQNLINSSNQDLPGLNKQALVYIIITFFNKDNMPVVIYNGIGTQISDTTILTRIVNLDTSANLTQKPYKITIIWYGTSAKTKITLDSKDAKKAYIPSDTITELDDSRNRVALIVNNSNDLAKQFPKLQNYPSLNFDPSTSIPERPIDGVIYTTMTNSPEDIKSVPVSTLPNTPIYNENFGMSLFVSDIVKEIIIWEGGPLIIPIDTLQQQNTLSGLVGHKTQGLIDNKYSWQASALPPYKDFILNNMYNPPIVTFNHLAMTNITFYFDLELKRTQTSVGIQISDTTILTSISLDPNLPTDKLPTRIDITHPNLYNARSSIVIIDASGDGPMKNIYLPAPDVDGVDNKSHLILIRIPLSSEDNLPKLENYPDLNFSDVNYAADEEAEVLYWESKDSRALNTTILQYDYTSLYNIVLTTGEKPASKGVFVGGPIIIPIASDEVRNTITALTSNKESLNSDTIWHGILLAPFKEFILNHI